MTETWHIVLSRSTDGRSYLASIVGNGKAIGIGPTPAIAVEELFRWQAAFTAPAPAPSGGEA